MIKKQGDVPGLKAYVYFFPDACEFIMYRYKDRKSNRKSQKAK
jgi:hypothetical protein